VECAAGCKAEGRQKIIMCDLSTIEGVASLAMSSVELLKQVEAELKRAENRR
jgi:hypothetical protein